MRKNYNNEPFLIVPQFILFNKQLDCTDKFILADIYSLSKLPKGCYKSQNGFGSMTNLTRSTISKRLEDLQSMGFINSIKIRPELKNSRKKYSLNMDKFKVNILPELTDKLFDNIVNEASSIVQIGNTTSSPLNIEVVHTGNTTSSPGVIYNNSTRTLDNLNRQEQDNIIKMNVNNKEVNSGISAAQFARNNISLLEDKIINASINGKLIIQNASYSTIKNLYDYVDNKNEYNLVLPLLKSLVDFKKRLHG